MLRLPGSVYRMGLAGDDELHRMLRVGQDTEQALSVVQEQIRSLVGREAARETQRQNVGVEEMRGGFYFLGRRAGRCQVGRRPFASVLDQRVADVRNCQSIDPARDPVEAEALYELLEREAIPEFYAPGKLWARRAAAK